ncbi:MAG: fibronectin type III domain-containing protein [Acutalibacteraceae bacterium]
MKRTIALLLCLFTFFTTVQVSVLAVPATTVLTQAVSAPAQVKNVKATAGASSVALIWSKVSGNVTYVVYEYNKSTKKYTKKGSTTSAKYTVKNLKSSTTYYFVVRAYVKSGSKTLWGKKSAVVSVKTTKPTVVAKVSGLKITTSGKSKYLKLSWKSQSGITGFQVYRSTSGKSGTYKKIASLKSSQLSYADTGLKNSTPYYYAVRAYKKTPDGYTFGSFVKIDLSTRITKSYIKKKIERANYLWLGWVSHGFAAAEAFDYKDVIYVSGVKYIRIKPNEFKSIAQMKAELATCFDGTAKQLYNDYIKHYYVERNGKLYGIEGLGEGGDMNPDRLSLINIKLTDTSCSFVVRGFCSWDRSYVRESDTCKLYYRNGNWVYLNDYPEMYENIDMYYGNTKWID